jgi:hypothetical protein
MCELCTNFSCKKRELCYTASQLNIIVKLKNKKRVWQKNF